MEHRHVATHGLELQEALGVGVRTARGERFVGVARNDDLLIGQHAHAGLLGMVEVLEIVAQHVGELRAASLAGVGLQKRRAQRGDLLRQHAATQLQHANGQVVDGVFRAAGLPFGARGVGGHLAEEVAEHLAQVAGLLPGGLQIFQEEVVFGVGQDTGSAAGCLASLLA